MKGIIGGAIFCALALIFTSTSVAAETTLAYKEVDLSDLNQPGGAAKLVSKAHEEAEKHPCSVRAVSEGRQLRTITKLGNRGDTYYVEITTADCVR